MRTGSQESQQGLLEAGGVGDGNAIDEQAGGAPQGGVDGMAGGREVAVLVGGEDEVGMTTGIDHAARDEPASLAHLGDLDQPVQRLGIDGRVGQVGFGQQVQRRHQTVAAVVGRAHCVHLVAGEVGDVRCRPDRAVVRQVVEGGASTVGAHQLDKPLRPRTAIHPIDAVSGQTPQRGRELGLAKLRTSPQQRRPVLVEKDPAGFGSPGQHVGADIELALADDPDREPVLRHEDCRFKQLRPREPPELLVGSVHAGHEPRHQSGAPAGIGCGGNAGRIRLLGEGGKPGRQRADPPGRGLVVNHREHPGLADPRTSGQRDLGQRGGQDRVGGTAPGLQGLAAG